MRRLSVLVPALLALALGGCFARGPQYPGYQYAPPPQLAQPAGPMVYAAPPAAAYQVSPPAAAYQMPVAESSPRVITATARPAAPRGFFSANLGGVFARTPVAASRCGPQGCGTVAAPAPMAPTPAPVVYTAPPAPAYEVAPPAPSYPMPVAESAPPVITAAPAPAPRGFFSGKLGGVFGRAPAATARCTPPGCGTVAAATSLAAYPQAPYLLDAGDRLRITVFGQEGLTNSYAVDAAGNITMPLVGTVPARGLTTAQLSASLTERLKQGYIREPKVAIEVEAYRPFFIHGEVASPGQYAYLANMTVENAIAIAGGFGPRADRGKVTVSRTVNGQTTNASVPLSYPLRPGDTLRVGERWF